MNHLYFGTNFVNGPDSACSRELYRPAAFNGDDHDTKGMSYKRDQIFRLDTWGDQAFCGETLTGPVPRSEKASSPNRRLSALATITAAAVVE